MQKRSEVLAEIQEELSIGLMGNGSYIKRVGNIFFWCGHSACVQRDLVFYSSRRHSLNFELLSMDWSYFTGTKAHALALQEAFGGRVYPSEYTAVADPMDLWIWEGPNRLKRLDSCESPVPLDFDRVRAVLFDEV